MLKNKRYDMPRFALYIILGALRPQTSAARKVQIILPQTVGNTDEGQQGQKLKVLWQAAREILFEGYLLFSDS